MCCGNWAQRSLLLPLLLKKPPLGTAGTKPAAPKEPGMTCEGCDAPPETWLRKFPPSPLL